ncbi:hypothetical protein YC2023_021089 [Brassica napus]
MPKTPFPNGWKGENGLYTVGFTKRGLLGTAFDAVKIAEDITDQWMKSNGPLSATVTMIFQLHVVHEDDNDRALTDFGSSRTRTIRQDLLTSC